MNFIELVLIFGTLGLLGDGISTKYFLAKGYEEGNPIGAFLIKIMGVNKALILTRIVGFLVLVYVFYNNQSFMLAFLSIIIFSAFLWNTLNIFIKKI